MRKEHSDSLEDLYKRRIEKRTKTFNLLNPISLAIMFMALGWCCWYLYDLYKDKPAGEIIVIEADDKEIKIKPEDPGGMIVDNMDKAIYDSIAGTNNTQQEDIIILPPAEEPINKSTIIIEDDVQIENAEQKQSSENAEQKQPNIDYIEPPKENKELKPELEKNKISKTNSVEEKALNDKFFKVQIASFKLKSDIEKEWQHLSKKFPKLIANYQHYIVTKESPSKGTFYKLQIGPFEKERDASKACKQLKEVNVNCFVIKP